MRRRGGCSWQHDNAELSSPCGRSELRVRGGLRRRVPGLPLRVQRRRLRRTRHSGSRQARPGRRQRAGRGRDRRPRRARTRPLVARVAVPPLARTAAIAAYLAALLWVDRSVDLHGQLALGALTWIVLVLAAPPLPRSEERR